MRGIEVSEIDGRVAASGASPEASGNFVAATAGSAEDLVLAKAGLERAPSPEETSLRQDIIPDSIRRDLKIIPETDPAAVAVQNLVARALREYLPGLDQNQHPVRVLLGDNPNVPGARIKYTPTTTIVLSRQQVLDCKTDSELMLVVLHELTHALLAKGYLPHELFDLAGIDRFRTIPEREQNLVDVDRPKVGKVEEAAAHTLPILLLAEAGKDPRVYGAYFDKLFADQKAARGKMKLGVLNEILDEHPLPEVTEGLAEAACVVFLNARGQLPTGLGSDLSETHATVRSSRYVSAVESLAIERGINLQSTAERISVALEFLSPILNPSRMDFAEVSEFLKSPPVSIGQVPVDMRATHDLAELFVQQGAPKAYEVLSDLLGEAGKPVLGLGVTIGRLVMAAASLRAALEADQQARAVSAQPLKSRLAAIAPLVHEAVNAWNAVGETTAGASFQKMDWLTEVTKVGVGNSRGQPLSQLLYEGLCSERPDFLAFRVAAAAIGCRADARFALTDGYGKLLQYFDERGEQAGETTGNAAFGAALLKFRSRIERAILESANPVQDYSKFDGMLRNLNSQFYQIRLFLDNYRVPEALPTFFDSAPMLWGRINELRDSSKNISDPSLARLLEWLATSPEGAAAVILARLQEMTSNSLIIVNPSNRTLFEKAVDNHLRQGNSEILEYVLAMFQVHSGGDQSGLLLQKAGNLLLKLPDAPRRRARSAESGSEGTDDLGARKGANARQIKAFADLCLRYVDQKRQDAKSVPSWIIRIAGSSWFESGVASAAKSRQDTLKLSPSQIIALSEFVDSDILQRVLPAFSPGAGFSALPLTERCALWGEMVEKGALTAKQQKKIFEELVSELESDGCEDEARETGAASLLSCSRVFSVTDSERLQNIWVGAVGRRLGADPEGVPGADEVAVARHHESIKDVLDFARTNFPRRVYVGVSALLARELEVQGSAAELLRAGVNEYTAREIEIVDKGWKVVEAITILTKNDTANREALLAFLLAREPGEYAFDTFAETLVDQVNDTYSYGGQSASQATILAEIVTFHENFWVYRAEHRALVTRQFFRVTPEQLKLRGGRERVELDGNTFGYVAKRLFPGEDTLSQQARTTVKAYADALDPIERPFVLSGLLFAARQAADKTDAKGRVLRETETDRLTRMGEAIAQFVHARDPGLQKLGQLLAGLPGVPEEIRRPSRNFFDHAAPVQRWDQLRLARRVEGRMAAEYSSRVGQSARVRRYGPGLGDGTMGSAIVVELSDDTSHALTLRKPFALERGQAGLATVARAAQDPALTKQFPAIAASMSGLVVDAAVRLATEADYSLTGAQYLALGGMFAGRRISHGTESLVTKTPECSACGPDFALSALVPGQTYARMLRDNSVPPFLQAARATQVFSAILHLNFDTDRSAGNAIYVPGTIYDIDPKAILMQKSADSAASPVAWPEADARLLGRLLGRVLMGSMTEGRSRDFIGSYVKAVDQLRAERKASGLELPLLVREANKAILTASGLLEQAPSSPYSTGFVLYSILRNGMHPAVAAGVTEEITSDQGLQQVAQGSRIDPQQIATVARILKPQIESFLTTGNIPPMAMPLLTQVMPAISAASDPIRIEVLGRAG